MADNDSVATSGLGSSDSGVERTFDWSQTSPSSAVVETVATATNTDPIELDAIQYSLDADALDTLVRGATDSAQFRIAFEYAGTDVVVTGDGVVRVRPD